MLKKLLMILCMALVPLAGFCPQVTDEQKANTIISIEKAFEEKRRDAEFLRFSSHLGFKESNNNPTVINNIGCFGEFQYKQSTLHYLGYTNITLKEFKKDPNIFPRELQLEALKILIKVNWIQLGDYQQYVGITINGVLITKSGMLAAAHLGGVGGVKLFLTSNGKINKKDLNNTSIESYIKEFQGYDL